MQSGSVLLVQSGSILRTCGAKIVKKKLLMIKVEALRLFFGGPSISKYQDLWKGGAVEKQAVSHARAFVLQQFRDSLARGLLMRPVIEEGSSLLLFMSLDE